MIGVADPERGQIVVAAVVTADAGGFDADALRDRLKAELSAYKIPRRVVAVTPDQLPLMSSGKIDVHRLRELLSGQA